MVDLMKPIYDMFLRRLDLRNLLLRAGRFGSEPNISVSVKLARAFRVFKEWLSAKKITCSQPPFTEGMVTRPFGICFFNT